MVEPPAGVKPESEIYRALANRLGFGPAYERVIPGPEDDQIEAFLEKKLKQFPDLSLKELKKGPVLAPGTEDIAFEDLVFLLGRGTLMDQGPFIIRGDKQQITIENTVMSKEEREYIRNLIEDDLRRR